MPAEPCIASWEAVEEFGDNCPLCGRACYTHELEEDCGARLAAASREIQDGVDR
jgi:hypothetical protein